MLSRYFVIALAIGVGVMQALNHAWIESAGLFGLGIGLTCLRLAETRANSTFRKIGWICLILPAAAFVYLLKRDFLR